MILVREAGLGLEVLMLRRDPGSRFMGDHWVFPGGALDGVDGEGQPGLRAAARRELAEEAGIAIAEDAELVPFARWITPVRSPIRFDTWFYLAPAPAGQRPTVDGGEIVAARWLAPARALALNDGGELRLAFPTRRQLDELAAFRLLEQLLRHARTRAAQIRPIMPVIGAGGEIVLP